MCTKELRIGGTNEGRSITMHNLNFIADPLNKKLVQGRWYTLIGMNPITSKYEVEVTLHLGDEERRCNRLASMVNSIEATPLALTGSPPPTRLTIMFVLISSLFALPSFL